MPYEIDPKWLELDRQFGDLSRRISEANSGSQKALAVSTFLRVATQSLRKARSPDDQFKVFAEVAHLLRTRTCDSEVWRWLRRTSISADETRRRLLAEAIFELVPEPPVNKSDLLSLWRLWENPKTRWAVYAAYRARARQFQADRKKLSSRN
jgi:hypothetical protein